MSQNDRPLSNCILYNENGNPLTNSSSFMSSTNGIVTATAAGGSVTSIAYLWHPNTNTKRIEIHRIDVGVTNITTPALSPPGVATIRGSFISAENGTPGGTSQTIISTDRVDSSSAGLVFRTGANAPTRVNGTLINWNSSVNQSPYFVWETSLFGKPIVLRSGVSEGFEIRVVMEVASAATPQISVCYYWTEI